MLLADDNADMREYLQRLLRRSYQVTTVADGQAALDAARAQPPDLVISDVMMPGLDGLSLVAALRADLRTAGRCRSCCCPPGPAQEAAIEGLEAGADDYLVKPFSAAELLARVRANVELARMRSHHARWRAALIDSLHEAFFLCRRDRRRDRGQRRLPDILGFGPERPAVPPPRLWWPDEDADPEAHRLVAAAFASTRAAARRQLHRAAAHRRMGAGSGSRSASARSATRTPGRMVVGTHP